jgi:hypothetical protein
LATPKLSFEKERHVAEEIRKGYSVREIQTRCNVSMGTVANVRKKMNTQPSLQETKKVGEFVLDEWLDWMESGQKLKKKASWSQSEATIKLGDGKRPQILLQLGDTHIASWGTSHALVRSVIKEINETPNLWVALMGDLIQMSIKLRNVLEVSDNLLPPEQQTQFLEKFLEKILDKIAFSSWCNHGVEREEKQSGISMVKNLLSRRSIYFNGIGHPDLQVGTQIYRAACSHKYRGNSMYDANFGNKRYARMEANDRELILQADLHRFAISQYNEGGMFRVAMTNGSFQLGSGYAQRYFSLKTCPYMPCVVLHHDRHLMVPFHSLDMAIAYVEGLK